MPKVLDIKGFKFKFYSNEQNEPVHVHVIKGEGRAKYWLDSEIKEEYVYGFNSNEQKAIKALLSENYFFIKRKWDEYFSQ